MTRQIRKHILNIRKHKPSKIYSNGGVLGWYKHLDKIERGLKYEILRTQKDARKQKLLCVGGVEQ